MKLPLSVIVLATLNAIVLAAGRSKGAPRRPPKPIKWNSSYYSKPFKLCKTLRELNPVEMARAHGVAVDAFRLCGPRIIIPYAQKYNFPAFAIMKASDLFCFLFQVAGGYFDLNDRPKSKDPADVEGVLSQLRRFCEAMKKGKFKMIARNGKQRFRLESHMCLGFVVETVECAFKEVGARDTQVGLVAVGHFRKLLL